MKAYLGQIDRTGLRRFPLEDALPADLMGQLAREWSSPTTTVVLAVVADDDVAALRAGEHGEPRSLLLDRAVEVREFVVDAPRIFQTAP